MKKKKLIFQDHHLGKADFFLIESTRKPEK